MGATYERNPTGGTLPMGTAIPIRIFKRVNGEPREMLQHWPAPERDRLVAVVLDAEQARAIQPLLDRRGLRGLGLGLAAPLGAS